MIFERLMDIYSSSKLNDAKPECIFAETLIFNEGWLLRGILEKWKGWKGQSEFPFLPFPDNMKIYSEAQLFTPFKKRSRSDKQGENNTHVDGIVGNFSMRPGTKSGIELDENYGYLAVFEAKMYSGLSSGVSNIKSYDQVSRTVACIINSVLKKNGHSIHFIVIYPEDSRKIEPEKYDKSFVERKIEERLSGYKQSELANRVDDGFSLFEKQWKDILRNINIKFITWEDILSELKDQNIDRFYVLCKKYNE